ncbi:MAG: terminase small subunit [Proteobacteria bacterium]|nr:terminase small subunit [Pseudomonadota bacterium]
MAEIIQIDYKMALDLSGARYTKKQRVFMIEYLKCLNGSEAARRAGYSVKCAHQQAYENLGKSKIRQAIDKAINGRSRITLIEAGVIGPDEDLPERYS